MSEQPGDCQTCKHHSKQTREDPLWTENGGEQVRTIDVVKYVCLGKQSPYNGQAFADPITCPAYERGTIKPMAPEYEDRVTAALKRLRSSR